MSTALDDFGQQLVSASRALDRPLARQPDESLDGASPLRRRRRFARAGVAVPVAFLLCACSALAGSGAAAYFLYGLFTTNGSTQTITSFTCDTAVTRGRPVVASVGIQAVTGDPIVDCAAIWPNATSGQTAAPPLTAWTPSKASFGAVVQPTAAGPPSYTSRLTPGRVRVHFTWQRLPVGWTVNLTVVELTDQLNDLPSETANGYAPACTYASRAVRRARALIRNDHASGWRVSLTSATGAISRACHPIFAVVDADTRTVRLGQLPAEPRPNFSHLRAAIRREDIAASQRWARLHAELASIQTRTNAALDARCSSVATAARLWTANAGRLDIHPTTLAYWREVNAHPPAPSSPLTDYYTLFRQPASQHTGNCARILVLLQGGGSIDVYAARIVP
jgi:hypothetical protein